MSFIYNNPELPPVFEKSPTEIERKFLIDEFALPPDIGMVPFSNVRLGYLAVGQDGTSVRLRDADGRLSLCSKSGYGTQRTVHQIPLTSKQFAGLWGGTEGRVINKTSHYLNQAGQLIELDIYDGELAGLVVGEVEFPGKQAAEAFLPPDWFGREVTELPQYKNQILAELVARMSTKPFMDVLGIELNSVTSDYLL